ncbi:MAG TPA: hypothetical protein VNT52_10330, partial [Acidimicrobiales bacterium]|nr:hypothetical protein [Acidimicrobiales bacterium]
RVLRKQRRAWNAALVEWRTDLASAARKVRELTAPELARLDKEEDGLQQRLSGLWNQRESYKSWASQQPEAERRLDYLTAEIGAVDDLAGRTQQGRTLPRSLDPDRRAQRVPDRGRSLDLDLGR